MNDLSIEDSMKDIAQGIERLNRTTGNPDVDRPSHYIASNGMEVWDFTEAFELGHHEASIVQYIVRWLKKDGLKDLYKARATLDRLIAKVEAQGA